MVGGAACYANGSYVIAIGSLRYVGQAGLWGEAVHGCVVVDALWGWGIVDAQMRGRGRADVHVLMNMTIRLCACARGGGVHHVFAWLTQRTMRHIRWAWTTCVNRGLGFATHGVHWGSRVGPGG